MSPVYLLQGDRGNMYPFRSCFLERSRTNMALIIYRNSQITDQEIRERVAHAHGYGDDPVASD
jgi:hypothetical protein